MSNLKKAYLLLQDGLLLEGTAIGKIGTTGGEICFNTGMTGYQEIYTDPSYYGQIIVNTTAHIGNYGTVNEEQESDRPKISGLVVNDFSTEFSRKTARESLQQYLEKNGVVGIADLDTRMLVRHIRSKGAMNAVISSALSPEELKQQLAKVPDMNGLELSSVVSTTIAYEVGDPAASVKIAALDFGIKTNILRCLAERGCRIKVFLPKPPSRRWNHGHLTATFFPMDPAILR